MSRFINYFLFLSIAGFLFSCADRTEILENEKLPKVKDEDLMVILDSLSSQEIPFFYSKVSTEYHDSTQNVSFKTSIRMVSDSAINTLITYASLPMFNAMVTTDSIKMTNKRENCYIRESLDFFRNNFNVSFTYRNLEELILGLPLNYDTTRKYFEVHDPFSYSLCTHRKFQIKRNDRKDINELVIFYTLTEDLKNLKSTRIESPDDSSVVFIQYKSRELVDGFSMPQQVEISITTPKKNIRIEMEYKKTRVGVREEMYFVIPEDYEICK